MNAVLDEPAIAVRTVPLGEVVVINPKVDRAALAADRLVSFVPMAAVGAADGQIDVSATRPYAEVRKGYTYFQNGDVLFAKVTPCMENGKMVVAHNLCNGVGFGSTEFHVLRPREGVDPHYLYHFVSSATFRKEAAQHMTGAVGLRRVPASFLLAAQIPLPDLDEQRRIVAEIEKQFSRLDEAVANLQRVKANLKRYKASVLKAAVEGRLVETEASLARREGRSYETGEQLLQRIRDARRKRWAGRGEYKEPARPNADELPPLPGGWVWATMPELGELGRGKSKHRPRDDSRLYGGRYPFIQTGDVRKSEGAVTSYTQTYSDLGLAQSRLWPAGTLCITIAANIAETGILTFDACFPDSVVGFLSGANVVTTRYVEYFIRTAKQNIEQFAPATAQKNINLEVLEAVAIPLPPVAEQHRIVAEVDRRLSIVREAEAEVDANLRRAQVLKQSVLRRAFSGEVASLSTSESNVARLEQSSASDSQSTEPVPVVMAAKIMAANCDEPTFGRVKLQKLMYLAAHHGRIEAANGEYVRMQAGPLDMQMLESVTNRLNDLRWFRQVERPGKSSRDKAYAYERLTKADDYRQHLGVLTPEQNRVIDGLNRLMRTWSSEECELFATVYAAWNDLILRKRHPTADAIIFEVREMWHESKKKFSPARISEMIDTIMRLNYAPTGWGRPTDGEMGDDLSGDLFGSDSK